MLLVQAPRFTLRLLHGICDGHNERFRLNSSPMVPPALERFEILDSGGLSLSWSDGHQTTLESRSLRAACPCAGCRGQSPRVRDDIRIVRSDVVGRYALQLFWNDGHGTGIYPFRLLREMCACVHCRFGSTSREEDLP